MKKIFLQPGQIAFQKEQSIITTIVGSCIAVCIWDKTQGFGGMCHYYLPTKGTSTTPDNNYGEFAIPNLLKEFKKVGSARSSLVAKVLGGGHVIDVNLGNKIDVGDNNIAIAFNLLQQFGITIGARSVGGLCGKKIAFNTTSGEVTFQNVRNSSMIDKEAKKIKVLIVDDSRAIRVILRRMIERDPEFTIIGDAEDPFAAMKIMETQRPDVITLDLIMPGMNGTTFLREHISKNPIPTIIVTAMGCDETSDVLDAMDLGAFDYIKKPSFADIEGLTFDLHQMLKAAHTAASKTRYRPALGATTARTVLPGIVPVSRCLNSAILIGSSTGGTDAVKHILTSLPAEIPPILIVQHMPEMFTTQFAERLNQLCRFRVVEAQDRMKIETATAYLAPGGKQMGIEESDGGSYIIRITDDPPVNRFKPSVDFLFDSAVKMHRKKMLAVILTGMGSDGAKGMLNLKNNKAHTIAQDEASSIVYGMPKAAAELNAASEIKSLEAIPTTIINWLMK